MLALYPDAAEAVDWSNGKFDAYVELTSPAARSLEAAAGQLVEAYMRDCDLVYDDGSEYQVGPVYVNDEKLELYEYSLHEGYSDLNEAEKAFARALDGARVPWTRNPSNGGYTIPLLEIGASRSFAPDFIAWSNGSVFLLDPKGGFTLRLDAGRKLLDIRDAAGNIRAHIRLISEGAWADLDSQTARKGFTIWTLRAGKPRPHHCADLEEAVRYCLELT